MGGRGLMMAVRTSAAGEFQSRPRADLHEKGFDTSCQGYEKHYRKIYFQVETFGHAEAEEDHQPGGEEEDIVTPKDSTILIEDDYAKATRTRIYLRNEEEEDQPSGGEEDLTAHKDPVSLALPSTTQQTRGEPSFPSKAISKTESKLIAIPKRCDYSGMGEVVVGRKSKLPGFS